MATAGRVYSSRAPIVTLNSLRVRVISTGLSLTVYSIYLTINKTYFFPCNVPPYPTPGSFLSVRCAVQLLVICV